jgi:hypothetical protein
MPAPRIGNAFDLLRFFAVASIAVRFADRQGFYDCCGAHLRRSHALAVMSDPACSKISENIDVFRGVCLTSFHVRSRCSGGQSVVGHVAGLITD